MSSFIATNEKILALNMTTLPLLAEPGTLFRRHGPWSTHYITQSADFETGTLVAIALTPENCKRIANNQPCEETETFNFNDCTRMMDGFDVIAEKPVELPWQRPDEAWRKIQAKAAA